MEPLAETRGTMYHENSDCQCKQRNCNRFPASSGATEPGIKPANPAEYSASPNPIVATTAPIAEVAVRYQAKQVNSFHNKPAITNTIPTAIQPLNAAACPSPATTAPIPARKRH